MKFSKIKFNIQSSEFVGYEGRSRNKVHTTTQTTSNLIKKMYSEYLPVNSTVFGPLVN